MANRLLILIGLVVGVTVAVTALAAYLTIRSQSIASLDASLLERAQAAAEGPSVAQLAGSVPPGVLGAADVRMGVLTPDGTIESASRSEEKLSLGGPELAVARHETSSSTRTVVASDGSRWRVVTVPIDSGALILAQALGPQERATARVGLVMLVIGGLGVLIAAAVGHTLARSALAPVRKMTMASEEVARTLELKPLEVRGDDELARLATSFNKMLSVLDGSLAKQRQLIADAGHELRTPLTSLRTNFELLVQSDRAGGLGSSARQELIDDINAQLNEMSSLITDLVTLAREDLPESALESVDFAAVVESGLRRARRRGASARFDVDLEAWPVYGDQYALERAVVNVLDNAIKWSPRGGLITVRLLEGLLTVEDQGPGMPEEHRELAFERFWRSPDARTMPGSGLGLAIVRQVVASHGGTVTIQDGVSGGTMVAIRLPASSRPTEPSLTL